MKIIDFHREAVKNTFLTASAAPGEGRGLLLCSGAILRLFASRWTFLPILPYNVGGQGQAAPVRGGV